MEITRGKIRVYGGCSRNSHWNFLSLLTVLFATCCLAFVVDVLRIPAILNALAAALPPATTGNSMRTGPWTVSLLRMYMLVFVLHSSFGRKKMGQRLYDLPWYIDYVIVSKEKSVGIAAVDYFAECQRKCMLSLSLFQDKIILVVDF